MTNADRIRAMSDEELAEMRAEQLIEFAENISEAANLTINYSKEQLKHGYLAWLRQEVSDDG